MRPLLHGVLVATACACLAQGAAAQQAPPEWLSPYRDTVTRLIEAAMADDFAWRRLAELTDTFGSRLSGSESLTLAIDWAAAKMKEDRLDAVRLEPVLVPRWVRGDERADIVSPQPGGLLAMLAFGGSVATPDEGIEAEVLIVSSFQELQRGGQDARGRIVLFNVPFTTYGNTVMYRTMGARAAAIYGAVASLVRSVGPEGLRTAHTGAVQYDSGVPAIPAAAIASEDADRIVRLVEGGQTVRVRLTIDARYEADVESANVVAEIRGREAPEEIVLLGGHLDSWDVGTGASDDAVGCIVTWEALRLMQALGVQPRRTVRLVLFTNEENGLRGATAYARAHAAEAANHVLALESDSGVFAPARLGFSGTRAARARILDVGRLLDPLGLSEIGVGGGGADIGPIATVGNVPTMAYLGDADRYFTVHHTEADTVSRITPDEVSRVAAAIAVLAYVVAEMPDRLPR